MDDVINRPAVLRLNPSDPLVVATRDIPVGEDIGFGKITNEAKATFDFVGDGSVTAAAGGGGAFKNDATAILEKSDRSIVFVVS